jgi:hypothetical protein
MKKLTSFTAHTTAEGQRVSYTYSEIDDTTGKLISQNNRESFIVLDDGLQSHIDSISEYINGLM